MNIYLVQHGKALSKEEDPNRHLSKEGASEVKKIAGNLKAMGVRVNRIVHSGKVRAQETANLFSIEINPGGEVVSEQGLNPNDDVEEFAKKLYPRKEEMYVGHLPFMEKLLSFLTVGIPEKRVVKFQNGGVVCLGYENKEWFVRWVLVPNI